MGFNFAGFMQGLSQASNRLPEAFRERALMRRQEQMDQRNEERYADQQKQGELKLKLLPLTHDLDIKSNMLKEAIQNGDVDTARELSQGLQETQRQIWDLVGLGAASQGGSSAGEIPMPNDAPKSGGGALGEVLGLGGEDGPVRQNMPAITRPGDPPLNPGDALQDLPATIDPNAPKPTKGEVLQPVGGQPLSVAERLAARNRDKRQQREFEQASMYGRQLASTKGAEAGLMEMERALGRPLTPEEKDRAMPLLREIAPVQDDAESLYNALMDAPAEERRGFFDGLPAETRATLLGKHRDLITKMPKVDVLSKKQGVEVERPLGMVDALLTDLSNPEVQKNMGPLVGRTIAENPYNTEAQTLKSKIKLASRMIGKYLEGTRFTDADAAAYEAMLPTMADDPEVAVQKLQQVRELLIATRDMYDVAGRLGEDGTFTLPDLPFDPNDSRMPPDVIKAWLLKNPEYEHGQELMRLYELRQQTGR